jgi:hypothetical protein
VGLLLRPTRVWKQGNQDQDVDIEHTCDSGSEVEENVELVELSDSE